MVTAVILIDNDSNRVLSKFFQPAHPDPKNPNAFKHPFQTLKEQRAFEAAIWEKTRRQNGGSATTDLWQCPGTSVSRELTFCPSSRPAGDILLYENQLVLYKQSIDLTFYIVGPAGENELMLQGVLTGFYDAVAMLLRHQVEKRSILENLDLVVLALDETIDNGCVRSPSAAAVAGTRRCPPLPGPLERRGLRF